MPSTASRTRLRALKYILVPLLTSGLMPAAQASEPIVEAPGTPGRVIRIPAPATPKADGLFEVDVLLLYTPGGIAQLQTDLQTHAAESVDYANRVFDSSEIPARYRLVAALPFPGEADPGLTDLPAMPAVTALRNAYGADLVSVFAGPTTSCGQAYTFNGGTFAPALPDNVDPERDAFNIVWCPYSRAFPHELGHNLGAGHDVAFSGQRNPATQEPIPGYAVVVGVGYWKDYAHGWRCGKNGGPVGSSCSIMHYCRPESQYHQTVFQASPFGDFFSNPRISRDGEACGSEGLTEADKADNARSITEALPYVAAYREPVAAPRKKIEATAFGGALSAVQGLVFALAGLGAQAARRARASANSRCRPETPRRATPARRFPRR